ncbi:sister chromatid cohesion protein PDS5 homolog D-like isoform X3 [Solanum lycopersicum]|uniref:sister chromatid cohesion protein PDS5 homolog D-like isoform X3 n=1 Tax=Solanum lycopersicum TaxID=4081 RepID=UPI000532E0E3|nr:uncharacterized protein LOC101254292 isoform X7 [Solanum lycopersicum]
MADSPTQKEIEDGLKDCANSLINIPHSTEELITLLDELESLLIRVAQAPADSIKDALLPVMEAVVRSELLKHTDADVIVSVISCIYEISRISAPQQPYDDELMKEIFQLTVRTFEELSHSGPRYQKAVNVLETVAEVKACLIMLDLDCHALVVEIIRMFLRIIRADHPDIVFTSMEIIMVLLIEESDEINMELLQPLLDSLRKENQILSPISSKLGEKVLKKCASTVRPCLLKALKSRSMDLNDHAEIIAYICNEMPKGEQLMENENVTTEKVGPSAAVICETLLEDGPPSNNNGTSSKTLQPCSQMEQPKNIGVSNCKIKSGSKRKPRQSSRKRGSVPEGDVDTTSGLNIVKREENLTHAEESSVQQIDEQKQKKEIHDIEESGNEEIKPSFGDGNLSSQLFKTKFRRKLTARKNQDFKRRQFTKKYGEEIVGTRIRVWWPLDKMFYEGAVSGFDHVNKRHQIAYDDGETEILNLNKEQFEFLEDNPSDKKHEADLQCNAVSSVPSKSNPQKCDFGSMDIPIPDKMNAEVGCETSSGKKELVDKEDKDTTQNQRLETSKIALESSLTREDHPSDEKHETDLQSHDVSAILSMKKKAKGTSSIKKEPGVSSSKRSKTKPKESCVESLDTPTPGRLNDAADVGCETSSGIKELVDKEQVAFESSVAIEIQPSDKNHETGPQSNDASSVPSMRKRTKRTPSTKKEPGVSSSKRAKGKPKMICVESLDIPTLGKMNAAADVSCETSSGIKELVDKEQVAFESSLAFEIQPSDKSHETGPQSNDASSVPSMKKRTKRTPSTKKEPGVSSSKRAKGKPKKICVESLDIPTLGKMNAAADVGCETSSGVKELVDKEQVAFESSLALESQPSDKNPETGPQSNDASSVPSMKKRTKRTPSTKKEPGVSSSKRAKGKPKRICVESLDISTLGKMNAAADVGCETSSGVKELVDKEQVAFESSLGLESQPSDKNPETGPQSNDASSVPSKKKRIRRTPLTKKEPGVSSSKRSKTKPKESCVESLDTPTPGRLNDAADVGCETSSGIKELVDKEQVAFESSVAFEIQPSDKNHDTGPQSNDVPSSLPKKKRTRRTPSTKKEQGASSSKRFKSKTQKSDGESLDISIPDKMEDASDVGGETITEKKQLVDNEGDMLAQAESKH